jgi:hypothetical protein
METNSFSPRSEARDNENRAERWPCYAKQIGSKFSAIAHDSRTGLGRRRHCTSTVLWIEIPTSMAEHPKLWLG